MGLGVDQAEAVWRYTADRKIDGGTVPDYGSPTRP